MPAAVIARWIGYVSGSCVGHRHHDSIPRGKGQQLAQGECAIGGNGVADLAVETAQDLAIGEFGEEFVHGIVEPEAALLDQDQCGDRSDRLGHRGNPKDRVALHRRVPTMRECADGVDMDLVVPGNERDDAGNVATLDVSIHDVVHAVEA